MTHSYEGWALIIGLGIGFLIGGGVMKVAEGTKREKMAVEHGCATIINDTFNYNDDWEEFVEEYIQIYKQRRKNDS